MFKKGDRVRKKNGTSFSTDEMEATVDHVEANKRVWLVESPTYVMEYNIELIPVEYPHPPHKHAEAIKAWADGADIEMRSTTGWTLVKYPKWNTEIDYRIKPAKTDNEIEKEKLVEELKAISKRIKELE